MQQVDFLVVGGGLFGVYTALYLADKNYKVCLVEKETELFKKASVVNQARLHGGYHYPRSIATALMADDHKERFSSEHKRFINNQYEQFYAIDKSNSFTNNLQFERFCKYINIPAEKIKKHPLFNYDKIEELYLTQEYSFDPILIAEYYKEKIKTNKNISLLLNTKIVQAEKLNGAWKINYQLNSGSKTELLKTNSVINATYAGTNSINAIFGMKDIELMYEISEMAFISSPEIKNIGLTVMDGPYASFMPYGLSGLLSLSSVSYTHHKVSYKHLPTFDCQEINTNCHPHFLSNCNQCLAKPTSNHKKMINQIKRYLSKEVYIQYMFSLFTVKTKLKSSYIDDGRPTEISKMSDTPSYYSLFAGKINSIYEIEKLISDEL